MMVVEQRRAFADARYEVLILRSDVVWVYLRSPLNKLATRFWSSRGLDSSEAPEAVVNTISAALEGVAPTDLKSFDVAVEIWPVGWDYWGIGVPSRIRSDLRVLGLVE